MFDVVFDGFWWLWEGVFFSYASAVLKSTVISTYMAYRPNRVSFSGSWLLSMLVWEGSSWKKMLLLDYVFIPWFYMEPFHIIGLSESWPPLNAFLFFIFSTPVYSSFLLQLTGANWSALHKALGSS